MRKLAVIGASDLQVPLIEKAQEKGFEVHAFAWAANDVGEAIADVFHPVSIVEHDEIVRICREVGVEGVCTIATDLGSITANEVARQLGLPCNSAACVRASTDKHAMRDCFAEHGCPSPKSVLVREADLAAMHGSGHAAGHPSTDGEASISHLPTAANAGTARSTGASATDQHVRCAEAFLAHTPLELPLIVKPTDRSGSRGVTKITNKDELVPALQRAFAESFAKEAVVEEYVPGDEYSVECFTWQGEHQMLAMTKKFTTGAPSFIETGHLEPAPVSPETLEEVRAVVFHALDALGVELGASHSELRIRPDGAIRLIEIGSRMGGDCIGSDLVALTTGIDFVGAVIDAAVGDTPDLSATLSPVYTKAEVKYLFDAGDIAELEQLRANHPERIYRESPHIEDPRDVSDSSSRLGFYICVE